jgi:hypothetical protein
MTGESADADQAARQPPAWAHEQRRPDPKGPGAADGSEVMAVRTPVIPRSRATRNLGRGRENYYVYLRIALIESMNPQWRDLSEGWFTSPPPDSSLRSE